MPTTSPKVSQELHVLSQLTLNPRASQQAVQYVAGLSHEQRDALVSLADANHVVVRAFQVVALNAGTNTELAGWANGVLAKERARIENALTFLHHICDALEQGGCPTTVMKSLDHWPDLGNDLDLYTTADERQVNQVMTTRMGAHTEPRSWGDRLANKWNFAVPGLPESVEVHAQRLGQTGEHIAMARRFVTRRTPKSVNGLTFLVPAPEERVIVATLQTHVPALLFPGVRHRQHVRATGRRHPPPQLAKPGRAGDPGYLDFAELKKAADMALSGQASRPI